MKSQAHLPIGSIGGSHWSTAKIVFASLVGAAALAGTVESRVLLNNPLLDSLRMSSVEDRQISGAHRVSLDAQIFRHSTEQLKRFSVAHKLPAEVATSQRFSIGADARAGFQVFGEAALRNLNSKKSTRKLEGSNQVMLMLMLARLRPHRY